MVIDRVDVIVIPLAGSYLFLKVGSMVSPPLPLRGGPESRKVANSLQERALVLFTATGASVAVRGVTITARGQFDAGADTEYAVPGAEGLDDRVCFYSVRV